MRRIVVTQFMSLDGVVQAPGGPGEDLDGGFPYGGWSVPHWDDLMGEAMDRFMSGPFDLLLGRRTYEIFAAYWPTAPDEAGAKPLNDATKYVVSRGRPTLTWERSILIDGDARAAIVAIKAGEGPELQVHGSGNLIQTLMRHGLIDEYVIWTFPVMIGSGKRLFGDGVMPASLRLTNTTQSTTGVVIATYAPEGDLETGTFADE